jgi:hypothetical protein
MQPQSPPQIDRQFGIGDGNVESAASPTSPATSQDTPSKPQSPDSSGSTRRANKTTSDDEDATEGSSERLVSPSLARIRGRLHEKEERFKSLMKANTISLRRISSSPTTTTTPTPNNSTTSNNNGAPSLVEPILTEDQKIQKLKYQLKNMALALHDKEMESSSLRKDLIRRKASRQVEKRSLYPELEAQLAKTQVELAKRSKECQQHLATITELTTTVSHQTHNSQLLQDELDSRLEKLVGYEIDLETHDIHHTSYLQEQQALEEEALDEIFDEHKKQAVADLEERHGCRAQELISKLLVDYADMEERYKRDRAEKDKTVDKLMAENAELKSVVGVLGEHNFVFSQNNNRVFLKRISQLERTNERLQDFQATMKERIEELEEEKCKRANVVTTLPSSSEHPAVDTTTIGNLEAISDMEELRRRLKDLAKTIAKLQTERSFQDEKIAVLKWQAVNHQMRNYPKQDDVGEETHRANLPTGLESTSPSVDELQEEIDLLKDILLQKDREVVKERKRFAQREASLLARFKDVVPDPKKVGSNHMKFFL